MGYLQSKLPVSFRAEAADLKDLVLSIMHCALQKSAAIFLMLKKKVL